MEDQLIDRHIAIINQAFFQFLELSGNALIVLASILSALTLLGMGWLALEELRPRMTGPGMPVKLACACISVLALLFW